MRKVSLVNNAVLVALFLAPLACSPAVYAAVTSLRCEYRENPLGIDSPKPRLSWIIESADRGARQTAYQILVATTPELLAQGKGNLWDSGKVVSDRQTQIEYSGKPLDSRQQCIDNTSNQSNDIRSYSLYWVLSLLDYYNYTGDAVTLEKYIANACAKLDDAFGVYGTNPGLAFYGWDERLGAGFEHHSCQESQNAYMMLSIRAWNAFAEAMGTCGRTDLRDKYHGYANGKMAALRQNVAWYQGFGLHRQRGCLDHRTVE